jgi:WD40 repeat protein
MTLKGHDNLLWSAGYSPDGQRIVTASTDGTAKVWEAQTGIELLTLTGHDGRVNSVGYSPDGQRIVTASKTARVWEAQTGQELMTLKGHDNLLWSAAYSPDGQRIATAGSDGIVQIYTTDMEELLQIADSRVTRQLTAEEKETYGVPD